jgi:sulfur-oxidizing protein SoxZ
MAQDRKMKMLARSLGNGTSELMVSVKHPMETGLRKDKASGKVIPAHFINRMTVEHNGKAIAEADLSIAISTNPIMGFGLKDAKSGDKVKVTWTDNLGETGNMELTLS